MLTFGSLFAGIGGMDLGLEQAGWDCRWQVEFNEYCREVLAKHWPGVRRHDDVRTFPVGPVEDWNVDLVAGGFPCQDVSNAGKRAGIDGERSGLWREMLRIVRLLRPRYVLVENTPGLLSRGLGRVLGDLAESGYDAEWDCLPAAAFGADHIRDRVFVVAYTDRQRPAVRGEREASAGSGARRGHGRVGGGGDSRKERLGRAGQDHAVFPDAASRWAGQLRRVEREGFREEEGHLRWPEGEPGVARTADGVSRRVDRNSALGNAVCPPVAKWLGGLIRAHAEANA